MQSKKLYLKVDNNNYTFEFFKNDLIKGYKNDENKEYFLEKNMIRVMNAKAVINLKMKMVNALLKIFAYQNRIKIVEEELK